jgi:hypothetical protein
LGRAYAGILGPLAFIAVLIRGWRHGWPTESILLNAWLAFVALAIVGLAIGSLAGWIIDDSVRARMLAEMAAREAARQTTAKTAEAFDRA